MGPKHFTLILAELFGGSLPKKDHQEVEKKVCEHSVCEQIPAPKSSQVLTSVLTVPVQKVLKSSKHYWRKTIFRVAE